MTKPIALTKEECYCDIADFYDLIAKKTGADPELCHYDCRYICVTKAVQDELWRYWKEEKGLTNEQIAMGLLHYGPKANLNREGYFVNVSKGFVS